MNPIQILIAAETLAQSCRETSLKMQSGYAICDAGKMEELGRAISYQDKQAYFWAIVCEFDQADPRLKEIEAYLNRSTDMTKESFLALEKRVLGTDPDQETSVEATHNTVEDLPF